MTEWRVEIIEVYDVQGECRESYLLGKRISSLRFDSEGLLIGYAADTDQTVLYRFNPKGY